MEKMFEKIISEGKKSGKSVEEINTELKAAGANFHLSPDGGVAGWTDAEMEDGFMRKRNPRRPGVPWICAAEWNLPGLSRSSGFPAAGLQSVMTRTATLRAPSGSMTDVFACARAQIYYNSKWKPLAQVKRESGCSHIINGYLFNGSFQPVGWTVIDGKVISRDAYQDWGISIGSDGKPQMLTDRGGSFLSGVPLLKNGAKLERSLTPDVARSAARTAVGWMPDGRICLWCDKTSLTREQLQNKLLGLGVADALMLDGGGSIQGFFPSGKVASSRKVPTMVLFWEETKQERNADLNWAGKSGILTEVQLAEPEKVVTRRELAEILHRLQK
jgi:hypothetical protein